MTTKGTSNAFPQDYDMAIEFGLTKREYFAIHILMGKYASSNTIYDQDRVEDAVKIADMLINELNK